MSTKGETKGREKKFFFLFLSSPRLALRAKYRVRPACLIKRLSAGYFKILRQRRAKYPTKDILTV